MSNALSRWVNDLLGTDTPQVSGIDAFPATTLAACALLLEVTLSDHEENVEELEQMQQAMQESFAITPEVFDELLSASRRHLKQSVSLYEHTRVLNDTLDHPSKIDLIGKMWQVAYADGHLDHYEEHLIRRVAELLYVEHRDFILAKLDARDQA
jgi:uncharacterized tellurite resistance protein B-like protein